MSDAKQRLQALSQQLVEGIPDAGTFEDIPRIRQVAPDSVGPLVTTLQVCNYRETWLTAVQQTDEGQGCHCNW